MPEYGSDDGMTFPLVSALIALASAAVFATATELMAYRFDYPRLRGGKGVKKIGFLPITHHIPETFFFMSMGWVWQLFLLLLPGLPEWTILLPCVGFIPLTLAQRPSIMEKNALPAEPWWLVLLAITVLAIGLLVGFFAPWPRV